MAGQNIDQVKLSLSCLPYLIGEQVSVMRRKGTNNAEEERMAMVDTRYIDDKDTELKL